MVSRSKAGPFPIPKPPPRPGRTWDEKAFDAWWMENFPEWEEEGSSEYEEQVHKVMRKMALAAFSAGCTHMGNKMLERVNEALAQRESEGS